MKTALPEKFGKFEVVREIGRGGFGVVYEGFDPILKRKVAIKTCTSDDESMRLRFQREAEIVASLQHPNITTVHDLGVVDGVPYLVQEYLSGHDLSQTIMAQKQLPLARKLKILVAVASGLEQAHRRGIIHRDIKPGNLRLLDDGSVKVMDFGIAKLLSMETQLTQTGMMIGTAAYLAPEQVSDEELDHRCDIFSFGVVAYELLTYQRPFSGTTVSALLYKINHAQHPSLSQLLPQAPAALVQIIDDCLSKSPSGRPNSFTEVLQRLRPVLRGLETGAAMEPVAAPDDATRQARGVRPAVNVASARAAFDLEPTIFTSAPVASVDPYAATAIVNEQARSGQTTPSTGEREYSESAMSQMFARASRPSLLAVAVMGLIAIGAVWFGLSRTVQTGSIAADSKVAGAMTIDEATARSPTAGETQRIDPTSLSEAANAAADASGANSLAAIRDSVGDRGSTAPANSVPSQGPGMEPRLATSPDITPKPAPPRAVPIQRAPARTASEKPAEIARPAPSREAPPKQNSPVVQVPEPTPSREKVTPPQPEEEEEGRGLDATQASRHRSSSGRPGSIRDAPPRATVPAAATQVPATQSLDHVPALQAVIQTYSDAIRAMDGAALRRIWPSLNNRQFHRIDESFRNAEAMDIDITGCAFDVQGANATATCRVSRSITPKAGKRQTRTTSSTFSFRLVNGRWTLDGV